MLAEEGGIKRDPMEIMGKGKPGKWCDYTWYVQVYDRACRSMNRQLLEVGEKTSSRKR